MVKKLLIHILIIASIFIFYTFGFADLGHRLRIDGSSSINCLLIDNSGHVLLIDGKHGGGSGFHRPGKVLGGGIH